MAAFDPNQYLRYSPGGLLMLFEIMSTLFLLGGLEFVTRVMGRRGDVLFYVSKTDPR
jgi:hypothetical protein